MAPERAPYLASRHGQPTKPIGKPFNGQAKGLFWLTWRSYAGPPQYYITPEGESPQPVREASAGPGQNPGSPGPKGPAAGSALTPVRACQPSGILESTAPPTGIYREMIHYRRIPRSFVSLSILVIGQVFFLKKFIIFS